MYSRISSGSSGALLTVVNKVMSLRFGPLVDYLSDYWILKKPSTMWFFFFVRGSGVSRSPFGPFSHQITFYKAASPLYQSYWLQKGSCSGQDAEFFQMPNVHILLRNFFWVHVKEVRKVAFKYCSCSVVYRMRECIYNDQRHVAAEHVSTKQTPEIG